MAFDGGSRGASFKHSNGSNSTLFFANPHYWTAKAKRDSTQPVALLGEGVRLEVVPDSPLQDRSLELLAHDIVDGKRECKATLALNRMCDCLLHRKPLAEFAERFDPATWKLRGRLYNLDDVEANPFAKEKPTTTGRAKPSTRPGSELPL